MMRSITVLFAIVLLSSLVITGCNQDDSDTVLTPGATSATLGMAPPTLEELQAALDLTAEQEKDVQSALSRWREANQEGVGHQRRRGLAEGGPHREGDPEQLGRRGRVCMTFLEDCAGSLTDEQFDQLIDLIAEKREQHQAACEATRQARRGERRGECRERSGPRNGQCEGDLALTDEARQAKRQAMREAGQALREGGRKYHEGDLTADAMRDLAAETLETLEGVLASVLDEDQFARFSERTRERATRRAERKLEHLDEAAGRRVASLTKLLGLEPDQVSAIEAALSDLRVLEEAHLAGIRDGETAFPDAVHEGLLIREAAHEAVVAILDEGQQARLEKLKRFKRGHRGLRLYF